MLAAQQDVEKHSQRKYVRRCCNRPARDLLWCGVLRRQRRATLSREGAHSSARGRVPLGIPLEQLGDAEVEQLDLSVSAHQYVGRLDVAVDDQIGVCVRDHVQHIEEQPQAGFDAQRMFVAVPVDALAVHVLENEIWLPARRDTGVDQVRDARMPQSGEKSAFTAETLFSCAADERDVQQFHGGASLEAAVAALRQPDATGSPLPDQFEESIGSYDLARQRLRERGARFEDRVLEKVRLVHDLMLVEQCLEIGCERGVLRAERRQPGGPLLSGDFERFVQVRTDRAPAVRTERRHWRSWRSDPRCRSRSADTSGPSPSCAEWSVPTPRAWLRFRRRRNRRKT